MLLTEQLLKQAAGATGAYTKRQLALIGVEWPPLSGWKKHVLGQDFPQDVLDALLAERTVRDARRQNKSETLTARNDAPTTRPTFYWGGSLEPVEIFLYVLELEDGHYYVGLTNNVDRRFGQHLEGGGAEWAKLHKPIRIAAWTSTGTCDVAKALGIEDEQTVKLMAEFGTHRVRGGSYCAVSQSAVETALRAHGHWVQVKLPALRRTETAAPDAWSDALDKFSELAVAYYDAGAPAHLADVVLLAMHRLSRHRYWSQDFEACLDLEFWGVKGVLPVLLTFKLNRVVGSGLAYPQEVLAAALSRGRNGVHSFRRLFLLAWQTFLPSTTPKQAERIPEFMRHLGAGVDYDGRFDAFVSVLFPEMRHRLREAGGPCTA